MLVKVLFFGMLKDVVGRAEDSVVLEPGAPLGRVFDHYAERYPRLKELERSVVLARNQQFAPGSTLLQDGDEVALLPPVSGGSIETPPEIADEMGFFALTRSKIDTQGLAARLVRGEDGALVTFEGVVRNNTKGRATLFLEYECYEAMAIRLLAQIGNEIAHAYPIGRIAIVHRLGRLEIGETSIAVLAAAPHRDAAFKAAREGIDRVKRLVPIWKKEHFADGEVWVDGQWDPSVVEPK